jgi:TonB family protein
MSETEIAQEATKAESADAADHNLKTGETVSGVVCGYNHPLKGASVTERDANGRIVNYAETNDKGQFSLKIKNPSNRLAVSYVGFHDFKCDLNQTDYQIKMEPSAAMDEVSVTAYYAKAADTPTSTQPKAPAMSEVFSIAEQMPVYPGGKEAWMQYVNSHIRYPAAAQNSGAQARIDVMFIVDRNGNVRSPKVERVTELSPLDEKLVLAAKNGEADAQDKVDAYNDGLESLKEEAVSILRHSSKWVPAQQNGNPVNCQYSIPIKFSLNHQVVIKPVKFPLLK